MRVRLLRRHVANQRPPSLHFLLAVGERANPAVGQAVARATARQPVLRLGAGIGCHASTFARLLIGPMGRLSRVNVEFDLGFVGLGVRAATDANAVRGLSTSGGVRGYYLVPAAAQLGIAEHMRFHDLRHTCASLMPAAGFTPFQVSRYLSHASGGGIIHPADNCSIRHAKGFWRGFRFRAHYRWVVLPRI
jgi:hypothetical protein